MRYFQEFLNIYKAKHEHFIFVEYEFWKRFKYLIKVLVLLNPNYKECTIFRKNYKMYNNIVVIGLKWNGRNVRRRTTGFAKEFLSQNKKINCLYCNKKLTKTNITTDHIIPISKGGNNSKVNLIFCCTGCNCERGDLDFYRYLKLKNPKNDQQNFF